MPLAEPPSAGGWDAADLLPGPRQPHMPIQLPDDDGCALLLPGLPGTGPICRPLTERALDRLGEADGSVLAGVDEAEAADATELSDARVEKDPPRDFLRGLPAALRDGSATREGEGEPNVWNDENECASDSVGSRESLRRGDAVRDVASASWMSV